MDFNLPALQNHIKRDPASYREEFTRQLRHFEHLLEILRLDPSANQPNFVELVLFLSHVRVIDLDFSSFNTCLGVTLLSKGVEKLPPDTYGAFGETASDSFP